MKQENKIRINKKHISTSVENSFGIHDFYYHYRNVKQGSMNNKLYKQVIKEFFLGLVDYIYNGFLILIPYGLGDMHIYKYKPDIGIDKFGNAYIKSNKAVDYKATKALWKTNPELKSKTYLYYENKHTDGYQFKLRKTMFRKKFLNKLYNFKPSYTFTRNLAQEIFNDPYREFLTE